MFWNGNTHATLELSKKIAELELKILTYSKLVEDLTQNFKQLRGMVNKKIYGDDEIIIKEQGKAPLHNGVCVPMGE